MKFTEKNLIEAAEIRYCTKNTYHDFDMESDTEDDQISLAIHVETGDRWTPTSISGKWSVSSEM